jgi:hypothetical protein
MKITTFNLQIITKNAEPIVKLFEELGFEKRHKQEGIGEFNVTGIRMKDENGFHLDISQPEAMPPGPDLALIRMNVDDFDKAYQLLVSHGFRNYYGDHTTVTKTSKSAIMISPTGFAINLIQHIKSE